MKNQLSFSFKKTTIDYLFGKNGFKKWPSNEATLSLIIEQRARLLAVNKKAAAARAVSSLLRKMSLIKSTGATVIRKK